MKHNKLDLNKNAIDASFRVSLNQWLLNEVVQTISAMANQMTFFISDVILQAAYKCQMFLRHLSQAVADLNSTILEASGPIF